MLTIDGDTPDLITLADRIEQLGICIVLVGSACVQVVMSYLGTFKTTDSIAAAGAVLAACIGYNYNHRQASTRTEVLPGAHAGYCRI